MRAEILRLTRYLMGTGLALFLSLCVFSPVVAQEPTPLLPPAVQEFECTGFDNTPLDHYRRATEFDRAGQNEQAALEYWQTIQCDKDYALAYRYLARIYKRLERPDEGIALFARMAVEDSQNALAHYVLGWLYMNAYDDWETTEVNWQRALEIDPRCALALNGMGVVHKHYGDRDAELTMYRAAMQADPGLVLPRSNILNWYSQELTDVSEASVINLISSLQEDLSTNPEQVFADERLYIVINLYGSIGKWEDARRLAQQLLTEYPTSLWRDYAYVIIATSYLSDRQYAQMIEPLSIAIEKFPDSALAQGMRGLLGNVYLIMGNQGEALQVLNEAIYLYPDPDSEFEGGIQDLLTSLKSGSEEARKYRTLGGDANSRGEYEKAISYCEKARQIAASNNDIDAEGEALSCLGVTYQNLGLYQDATIYYHKLLKVALASGDKYTMGIAYGGLGTQAIGLGEYYQAIHYFQLSLDSFEEVPDNQTSSLELNGLIVSIYDQMGTIYSYLGNYELAEYWLKRAFGEMDFRQRALPYMRTIVMNNIINLGVLYFRMGEKELALKYFKEALELETWQVDEAIMLAHLYVGRLYIGDAQFTKAINEYNRAIQLAVEHGNLDWEVQARMHLGQLYIKEKNYEDALVELQLGLKISHELNQPQEIARNLYMIGEVYQNTGNQMTASEYFYRSVLSLENYVESLSSGATRGEVFEGGWYKLYRELVESLMSLDKGEEAYEISERSRARTLLDSLANGQIDFREGADTDLLERSQTLRTEIGALDHRLQGELSQPHDQQNPTALQNLETQLQAKREEYSLLLNQLQATNPEYAALALGSTLSLTATQALLNDQTTLLEYFVAEDQTVAFVLTHDSFNVITIPVSSDTLMDTIITFRDFANREPAHPQSLIQLYDWLIAPVRPYLKTPQLGIVPHRMLHYLPFAALTDGGRYLVEDFTLFTLPSASILPYVQPNPVAANPRLVAIAQPSAQDGPYLSHAVQEAATIAALWDTTAIVDDAATETAVYSQTVGVGIVHIVAHGTFNPFNPLFSELWLGADAHNDGNLEVHEVYGMDLTQAQLVVLSGCETDMSHLTRVDYLPGGDELVGLNRAFLFAGTPTVVGSLWRVDDASTALLMERFYTYLKQGQGKAAALRQAQLDTRAQYPHPYYWAGFVLTGDGAASVIQPPFNWLRIVLLGIVGLLVAGGTGYWGWQRHRQAQIQVVQAAQLQQLLDARARLLTEPETVGRVHALRWVTQEIRELGKSSPHDSYLLSIVSHVEKES
ncbi:MAG: CHAT domain-containing protein [Anaerolineae bacterium]|nr:CHAT domain-containing protein [Anaerolineae bacterium]